MLYLAIQPFKGCKIVQ